MSDRSESSFLDRLRPRKPREEPVAKQVTKKPTGSKKGNKESQLARKVEEIVEELINDLGSEKSEDLFSSEEEFFSPNKEGKISLSPEELKEITKLHIEESQRLKNITGATQLEGGNSPQQQIKRIEIEKMTEDFSFRDFSERIPECAGENELIKTFISRCDEYHNTLNDEGKILLFKNLVYKVRGKLFISYKKTENWVDLKKTILGKQVTSLHSLLRKLDNIKQGGKSVRDFADEVAKILEEIDYSISINHEEDATRRILRAEYEKVASRVFKEGLREPLRSRVFACSNDKNLEETMQIALEEEPFTSTSKEPNNFSTGGRFNARNGNSGYNNNVGGHNNSWENRNRMRSNTDTWSERINRNQDFGKIKPEDARYQKGQMTCYRCGRTGHGSKDCFARIDVRSNQPIKKEFNTFRSINIDNKSRMSSNEDYNKINNLDFNRSKNFLTDRLVSSNKTGTPTLSE